MGLRSDTRLRNLQKADPCSYLEITAPRLRQVRNCHGFTEVEREPLLREFHQSLGVVMQGFEFVSLTTRHPEGTESNGEPVCLKPRACL